MEWPAVRVRICDMGIAGLRREGHVTVTDVGRRGTTPYMAPEMFSRSASKSLFADVWSYGCVLIELVSENAVWAGYNEAEIVGALCASDPALPDTTSLPMRSKDLCDRCFVDEPCERPTMSYIFKELFAWPLIRVD